MDAFGSTNKVRVLTLAEHTVKLIPQVTQVP